MRKMLFLFLLIGVLAVPAAATELSAPEVPRSGREYMPGSTDSFGEGLAEMLRSGRKLLQSELGDGGESCSRILLCAMLVSVLPLLSEKIRNITNFAGAVSLASLMLQPAGSMIGYASERVWEICEYGKLLCPVLTTALAAQGGVSTSAVLYGGTTIFLSLLDQFVSRVMIPMVYLYLLFSITHCALGEEFLKKLADAIKSMLCWMLKTMLILFTTYLTITGVVSGTTDAAALKAAKVTVSTVVPVIGGILSDASESVLSSMSLVKNAAGVSGILAVAAVFLGPFVKLGVRYLLLKATSVVCSLFADKQLIQLVESFSAAMGMLLAMVASGSTLVLISTVCYMKGMNG